MSAYIPNVKEHDPLCPIATMEVTRPGIVYCECTLIATVRASYAANPEECDDPFTCCIGGHRAYSELLRRGEA